MASVHSKKCPPFTPRIRADADLAKAVENLDSGPEPSFETLDRTLVEPPLIHPKSFRPRPLSPASLNSACTTRQRTASSARCTNASAGPEIKLFHRAGINPILYSSTLIGPNIPNLTYLIPFDSLAHRETAWTTFNADAEWIKVRKESIDKNGQISSVQNISLWKATDYSPVR